MPELGDVRREDHEDGYSLWVWMPVSHWDEPAWSCVYSTAPEDVGYVFADGRIFINGGIDVGKLPGMDG